MLRCTWCLQNLPAVTGWNSQPIPQVHNSLSSSVVSRTIWLCKLWEMYVGANPVMLQYCRQVRTLSHTPKDMVSKEVHTLFLLLKGQHRLGTTLFHLLTTDYATLSSCRALHSHICLWLYGLHLQHCYCILGASWRCRILHSDSAGPKWAFGNMHVLVIELWHAQTVLWWNIQC